MKPLTTSAYTFEKLVQGGFLYVDKTHYVHRLVEPPVGQYFLARPRRFGKSLLVSTLRAVFEGQRELFRGLAIGSLPYEWERYPVIHLDLAASQADTRDELEQWMSYRLGACAEKHGVALSRPTPAEQFMELVEGVAVAGKVAILVDEYDKPLLGHLTDPETARDIQQFLKSFYSVIKATEPLQRFVLLTGVSKFSKVSVFSDLNNLTDLTWDPRFATMLGYTQPELENSFSEYIDDWVAQQGVRRDELLRQMSSWYDGYRFHEDAETVYNPVSVMRALQTQEFRDYWFETGTPTFLVELLKQNPVDVGNLVVRQEAFSTYDVTRLSPLPLLVQTGYLTITDIEREGSVTFYRLDYPNREVAQAFSSWVAQEFSALEPTDMDSVQRRVISALRAGDVEEMLEQLKVFFAGVPHTITLQQEKYYQTIFYVVFKLLGAMVEVEVATNRGRVDAVVQTGDRVYIFEFKLHETAESALEQIRSKGYAERYRGQGKEVVLVGVGFDAETRNLGQWVMERA